MALFALARYLDSGDLDLQFGDNGKVTTAFAEGEVNAFGIAVDSQDRVVTAGAFLGADTSEFAFTRHLPSGELDPAFGGDGRVRVAFPYQSGSAMAVTTDSDERIVAVGGVHGPGNGSEFAVVRLLEDGTPDPSFGDDGRVVAGFDRGYGLALGVSIGSLDQVVAAGFVNAQIPGNVFAVLKLREDGSPDPGFGTAGRVTVEFSGIDTGFDVVHDERDRVIVVGKMGPGSASDACLCRLLPGGRLDPTFGVGGRAYSDLGGSRGAGRAVALASTRRIVVAGLSHVQLDQFGFAQLLPGGDHDQTFSSDGRAGSAFLDTDGAQDVAVDGSGRVVATGYTGTDAGDTVFATARLLPDGTPDLGFGLQGQVFTNFVEGSVDQAQGIALDSQGRIVVGGSAGHPFGWPLGHGLYRAGLRSVKAIPLSEYDMTAKAVIYYPATREGPNVPLAVGPRWPVAAYIHGNRGGDPCEGTPTDRSGDLLQLDTILRHLARWGYVVISADASAAPPGGFFQQDLMEAEARFLLAEDGRQGSPFENRLRTDGIILLGHSTGGGAAFALAAAGALDVGAVAGLVPAGQQGSIGTIPSLTVGVTRDDGTFGGNAQAIYDGCDPPKHLLIIGGGNHFGFTESLCFGTDGEALISRHDQQRIALAYLTAFLERYIRNQDMYAAVLTGAAKIESLEPFDLDVQAQI